MTEFTVIETRKINNAVVDGFYHNKDAWFTRTQIGEALGYDDPNRQVAKLHNRHKDRLNPLSAVVKMTTTDGKSYDTFVYSFRGVLEICRWSKQEKANEVMDALYDMAESVREKGYFSCMSDSDLLWLLVDKCLDSPKLEDSLKNRHLLSDLKKMRLRDEKESARYITRWYNQRCKEIIKKYNKHPDEEGFKAEYESATRDAMAQWNEDCPHLLFTGYINGYILK